VNVWQVCQAIQGLLRAQVWPGSSNVVFDTDSVRIIPQGDEISDLDEGLIPPLCLIMPLGGEIDPEHREEPTLVRRTIDITLVTVNQGDRIGETPIMGGQRADALHSGGRGLLEIEEQVFNAIAKLNIQQGIVIQFAAYGEGQVRRDQGNNYIGIQDYTFQVWCSTTATYQGASNFTATGRTGEIDLAWTNPTVLQNTYRSVLMRKPGATAPTSITDGTVVSSSVGLAISSYADTPLLPGTYSYSLFITYDGFNATPTTDQVVSIAASGTAVAS